MQLQFCMPGASLLLLPSNDHLASLAPLSGHLPLHPAPNLLLQFMPVRASMQQYRTHRDQTSFLRCYSGSRPSRGSPGCAAQRQQQLALQFLLHLQATCGQLREKLPRLGDVVLIDQLRPQRRHSFPQHLWAWQGGSPKHRAG